MLIAIPFACDPGNARLARVFSRLVQKKLARNMKAVFQPLAAIREGEVQLLNRREPFEAAEAAKFGREQGADLVLDGWLGEVAGPLLIVARPRIVDVASAVEIHRADESFALGGIFDSARLVARAAAQAIARADGIRRIDAVVDPPMPPVADLEALNLFFEAEELAFVPYASEAELKAAGARRAELLAQAGRRDPRIQLEIRAR